MVTASSKFLQAANATSAAVTGLSASVAPVPANTQVLDAISKCDVPTTGNLAGHMQTSEDVMARALKTLEAEGLVEIDTAQKLTLTSTGSRALRYAQMSGAVVTKP